MNRITEYGFEWGPLEVVRLISDRRYGYVIAVTNGAETLEIRSTPKGRRPFDIQHRAPVRVPLALAPSTAPSGASAPAESATNEGGAIED